MEEPLHRGDYAGMRALRESVDVRIAGGEMTRSAHELRELLRYRRKLVEVQAAERNRLQRLLETANIKLGSVATDVFVPVQE